MSFGLAEHFRGTKRIKINKAHFDVLRKGGIAFISVPNKHNPPYRISKFVAEHTGRCTVGEEYPYSRKELRNICEQIGITKPNRICPQCRIGFFTRNCTGKTYIRLLSDKTLKFEATGN
jgi:hypothetical protein